MRGCILEVDSEGLPFSWSWPKGGDIPWKERATKKGALILK